VALREALDDERVAALVLIGTPLEPKDLTLPALPPQVERKRFHRPVLVVAGDNDEYCPADEARTFAISFPDGRLALLEGTDHYLWRRERETAALVGGFVDGVLAGS
jgi:pimeloyl-ACP methyl ester carboxylesterase